MNVRPAILFASLLATPWAHAQSLRINLPKHTDPTPVQKINQDDVKALKQHHLEKAERLFYRAYLIDPEDPFTLNNLGYVSELRGKVDRAQRYYELAAKENNSETTIAAASSRNLEGHKLSEVTTAYGTLELRINRGNLQAMTLLSQGRNQEAEDVLRETLKLAPRNPFTLNNLGFAMERQGDLDSALRYYNDASITHSSEPVVVAIDPHWTPNPWHSGLGAGLLRSAGSTRRGRRAIRRRGWAGERIFEAAGTDRRKICAASIEHCKRRAAVQDWRLGEVAP